MRETLYTIPVNEGFEADDECPFCAMQKLQGIHPADGPVREK